ncbi:MAG: SDR family oxidoreductase [Betaproteobacteria bacterium]
MSRPPPRETSTRSQIRPSLDTTDSLCLFGIGTLLESCFEQIVLAIGRAPDLLCDNAPEKWGHSFHGVTCVAPDDLPADRARTIILICIRNYEAVNEKLRALGFSRIWLTTYDRGYHRVSGLRPLEDKIALSRIPEPLNLKGQWTFVTGATRGIGQQIAQAMAFEGLNIICHGKTIESAQRACRTILAPEIETRPVAADLSNPRDIDTLCEWLEKSAPPIAVAFNNAGISPYCSDGFWKIGSMEFSNSYMVNTIAPIRICQAVIPGMKARGFGRVINVSSSIQKRPEEMAYACSKAALDKFVHDFSPHLEGTGVMMSLLDPGWLRTDMGGIAAQNDVNSVLPGALLGALINTNINGQWFSAQDYSGLTINAAIRKAFFIGACS